MWVVNILLYLMWAFGNWEGYWQLRAQGAECMAYVEWLGDEDPLQRPPCPYDEPVNLRRIGPQRNGEPE